MKYHETNKAFKFTINGEDFVAVAKECETLEYMGETFRKSCYGCLLAKPIHGWCSGHGMVTYKCRAGGCESAKCSPEYREDGKYIHYKYVKKN